MLLAKASCVSLFNGDRRIGEASAHAEFGEGERSWVLGEKKNQKNACTRSRAIVRDTLLTSLGKVAKIG